MCFFFSPITVEMAAAQKLKWSANRASEEKDRSAKLYAKRQRFLDDTLDQDDCKLLHCHEQATQNSRKTQVTRLSTRDMNCSRPVPIPKSNLIANAHIVMLTAQAAKDKRARNREARERNQAVVRSQTVPVQPSANNSIAELHHTASGNVAHNSKTSSSSSSSSLARSKSTASKVSPRVGAKTSSGTSAPRTKAKTKSAYSVPHVTNVSFNDLYGMSNEHIHENAIPAQENAPTPRPSTTTRAPSTSKAPSTPATSSSSSTTLKSQTAASTPTVPSTASTPPTPTTSNGSPPSYYTSFNNLVLAHLRRQWAPSDTTTRDQVLTLVDQKLRHLPTSAGREQFSTQDTEQDFIERRALIAAQCVRRDLVRDMEVGAVRRARRGLEKEEREFWAEGRRRMRGGRGV